MLGKAKKKNATGKLKFTECFPKTILIAAKHCSGRSLAFKTIYKKKIQALEDRPKLLVKPALVMTEQSLSRAPRAVLNRRLRWCFVLLDFLCKVMTNGSQIVVESAKLRNSEQSCGNNYRTCKQVPTCL